MPTVRLRWSLPLVFLALGLAVGWFAIGWGVFPVPLHDVGPAALAAAPRSAYLEMVAESLAATGDVDAARSRLSAWSREQLARDLADLQIQLEVSDPARSAEVASLSRALTAFSLPTEPAAPAAALNELAQAEPSSLPPVSVVPAAASALPAPSGTPAPAATPAASSTVSPTLPAAASPTITPTLPVIGTPSPAPTPLSLDRTENFLVLGTDNRAQLEGWRTDTIMIVALDRAAGQVGILSIPRDLYVDIPGYGKERINAADYIGEKSGYPGGGPALVRRVVEQTVGIPTQHYVQIKQDGLAKLVDALGGITVTLACPLYEMAPEAKAPGGYIQFSLPAGSVFLDGAAAKKFATFRYITGDFGRERRQQQVIWAIRNRALKGDVLPRIPQLWSALSDTFTTDLGLTDVISLATLGMRLQPKDIHARTLGMDVLQNYTTPQGWEVLLVRNRAAVLNIASQIFAAPPLIDAGKPVASSGCPAAPRGFRDLSRGTPAP